MRTLPCIEHSFSKTRDLWHVVLLISVDLIIFHEDQGGQNEATDRASIRIGITRERCHDLHVPAGVKEHLRLLVTLPSALQWHFFPVCGLQRPATYIYFLLQLLFGSLYWRQGRGSEVPGLFSELQPHSSSSSSELVSLFGQSWAGHSFNEEKHTFMHRTCHTGNWKNTSSMHASKPAPWTGVTAKGLMVTCHEETGSGNEAMKDSRMHTGIKELYYGEHHVDRYLLYFPLSV